MLTCPPTEGVGVEVTMGVEVAVNVFVTEGVGVVVLVGVGVEVDTACPSEEINNKAKNNFTEPPLKLLRLPR